MSTKNKYIIVTNDSDSDYARTISHNIHAYLQKELSESHCYTYEDVCSYYDSFHDEREKIAQFLVQFDCEVGFQNIYWLFFITSNSENAATAHWDQQLWTRAGKIIGQFSLRTENWKNQISFWEFEETATIDLYRFVLDGTYKTFCSDYKNVYQYVAGAERKNNQLSFIVLENTSKFFNKEIPICPINNEFNTISFSPKYQKIFLGQYNGHLESITIISNEKGEIVLTANISEITIRNDKKDGGA